MKRFVCILVVVAASAAHAQGCTPQKNVGIVAASGPGGGNDNSAHHRARPRGGEGRADDHRYAADKAVRVGVGLAKQ